MKVVSFSDQFPDIKITEGVFFKDERGSLKKVMFGEALKDLIDPVSEVIVSNSKKNVIRGLHFQDPPHEVTKLVTCVSGKILDCFLDIRKKSPTYGLYSSVYLEEDDKKAILIPKGFAHGYSVISDEAIVVYLQSGHFSEKHDQAINPLSLNIDWKVNDYNLSYKDKNAVPFDEFETLF